MNAKFLIEHANSICKSQFMDFPDYEEGQLEDVASALTVIVQSTVDHNQEFDEAAMYDYFAQSIFPDSKQNGGDSD